MSKVTMTLGIGAAMWLASTPAAAATVEEVVEKHIQARGGRQNWEAIETMQVTGTFRAFSVESPFTLTRKKGNLYHLDHVQNDRKVVIGYDGETAWWDNHWNQPGAAKIDGPDLGVVLRDAEFPTPFFHYKEQGYELKLLGETEFEGFPAIGIELRRGEETETWYLDPETYLELARVSPGSDFGQPMPQRTFYDDWREVSGVMIPHLTETQWYTRDRVMMIEDVKTNIPVDGDLFVMPAPPGMGPFRDLAGDWTVALEQRSQPGGEFRESKHRTTIEPLVAGTVYQEIYTTESGTEVVRTLSYDRFREEYRVTQIASDTGLMDVKEGSFDENGRLTVSNEETGTTDNRFGLVILSRWSLFDLQPDGFETEWEVSIDGGENWWVAAKATYTRGEEAEQD